MRKFIGKHVDQYEVVIDFQGDKLHLGDAVYYIGFSDPSKRLEGVIVEFTSIYTTKVRITYSYKPSIFPVGNIEQAPPSYWALLR